jgi:hypothetical protein
MRHRSRQCNVVGLAPMAEGAFGAPSVESPEDKLPPHGGALPGATSTFSRPKVAPCRRGAPQRCGAEERTEPGRLPA